MLSFWVVSGRSAVIDDYLGEWDIYSDGPQYDGRVHDTPMYTFEIHKTNDTGSYAATIFRNDLPRADFSKDAPQPLVMELILKRQKATPTDYYIIQKGSKIPSIGVATVSGLPIFISMRNHKNIIIERLDATNYDINIEKGGHYTTKRPPTSPKPKPFNKNFHAVSLVDWDSPYVLMYIGALVFVIEVILNCVYCKTHPSPKPHRPQKQVKPVEETKAEDRNEEITEIVAEAEKDEDAPIRRVQTD